jgi:hypothetical protein
MPPTGTWAEIAVIVVQDSPELLFIYIPEAAPIRLGRFTADQIAATRAEAARIIEELERDGRWWAASWASWEPDPGWPTPSFPTASPD